MISRKSSRGSATIASGAAVSEVLDLREMAGGTIITPATLNATTVIGFKVCDTESGTFVPLYDQDNSLVYLTVQVDASRAYPLPDELFGAQFFKLWACTTGAADVDQTGSKAFALMLKG
jgi:hypothetical protein